MNYYALDTNAVIFLLRGNTDVCHNFDTAVINGDVLVIPPVVHYEMQRGFLYRSAPTKERAYRMLLNQYAVGEMCKEAWEKAAELYADLRSKGRTVDDADILIAAFSIVNDYILVTNNLRHFEGIDALALVDWAH